MRKHIKKIISLTMTAVMVFTSFGINDVNAENNFETNAEKVAESENALETNAEEEAEEVSEYEGEYEEGEALIMYYDGGISLKSYQKKVESSYDIEDTLVFEDAVKNTGISVQLFGKKDLKVSLVKSSKLSTKELIDKLKEDSSIVYAEPNYKIHCETVNENDYTGLQWALDNRGQNGGLEGADIYSDDEQIGEEADPSQEKVIALVDSGVDMTHSELQNVIWTNPFTDMLPGTHGYDVNQDESGINDVMGHGTHCAGIMAARIDDNKGISGVIKDHNIKIMPLQISDDQGYFSSYNYVIKAYNYIYKAQQLGVNIVVINNSWGGEEKSDIFLEIINLVGESGALSVCAAGNYQSDNDRYHIYPSDYESEYIISVAASNDKDELAFFTNYGAENVDIAAPGENILSTVCYNRFNPIIYSEEKINQVTSLYYSFDKDSDLVETIDDDGLTGNNADKSQGDIAYGLNKSGNANVSLQYDCKNFFGKNENNKSLKISIDNAKAGDVYKIFFPYEVGVSETPIYNSFFYKTETVDEYGNAGLVGYDVQLDEDGKEIEGTKSLLLQRYYAFRGQNELNQWNFFPSNILMESEENQLRAICFECEVFNSGDFNLYIDSLGISKENVQENDFEKYDWYSGTSMAAPHVTAAVALVTSLYPEKTPLEIKKMILGSARRTDSCKGKMTTDGVLDLSHLEKKQMYVESISANDDDKIIIKGNNFEGTDIYIQGELVQPIQVNESQIIIDGREEYYNRTITVELINGNEKVVRTKLLIKGKKYDCVVGAFTEPEVDDSMISTGNEIIQFYNSYVYVGKVSNNYVIWKRGAKFKFEEYGISNMDYGATLRPRIAYYNGFFIMGVYLNKNEKGIKIVAYDLQNEKWFELDKISYDSDTGYGYLKMFVYNGGVYLYASNQKFRIFYKLEGKIDSDKNEAYFVRNEDFDVDAIPGAIRNSCAARVYQLDDKLVTDLLYKPEITWSSYCNDSNVRHAVYENGSWMELINDINLLSDDECKCALVKEGIMYVGAMADGLGNTFYYDFDSKSYKRADYNLEYAIAKEDYSYSGCVSVKDRLYLICQKVRGAGQKQTWFYSIPINSPYINVEVGKIKGINVKGEKNYTAGDIATLKFEVKPGYDFAKILVNGEEAVYDAETNSFTYSTVANNLKDGVDVKTVRKHEEVSLEIQGYQINTTLEGHRTIFTVDDTEDEVAEVGMIYGLADYASEDDMVIDSDNSVVYSYAATEKGKISAAFNTDTKQTYAFTLKFIKIIEYYNSPIMMRVYARLKNGDYVYGDVETRSVFDIADYLYTCNLMPDSVRHNYLYDNILSLCAEEYIRREYEYK